MGIYVLITMFQGAAILASPLPGPSVHPNTPVSEGSLIRAPRVLLGISDAPSNDTPISEEDELSDDSKVLDPSQLPLLGTAAHVRKDPEAHDTDLLERSARISPGNVDNLWLQETIHLDDLRMCSDFVKCLQVDTLSDPSLSLSEEAVEQLCNPPCRQSSPPHDADQRLVLELYLLNPSEATYKANCAAFVHHSPHINLPSYYRTTHLISKITGIELVVHHMCINSCIMYVAKLGQGIIIGHLVMQL